MKRWRILILALCCTIFTIAPVSASVIEIENVSGGTVNFDLDSVQVVTYNPPNYVIQFKLKDEDPEINLVNEIIVQMVYDYDKQDMKSQILLGRAAKYYGSQLGPWIDFPQNRPIEDVSNGSTWAVMGNLAFYKAYHMYFYKSWQDAYGTEDITNRDIMSNLPK